MKPWVDEAYQMYILGFTYAIIEDQIGVHKDTIRHHIKKYAYTHGLIYPRLKPDYKLAFNLYYNTMSVRDIARYFGVCVSTAQNYIKRYSEMHGIPTNQKHSKGQVAFHLRERGFSYNKIAKMLGYQNKSNCYRAIKKYKSQLTNISHTDDV
jgi:uncharacterized protein YjcR